ncbi:hypothetical protein ACTD5D_34325 [Nocardia takedensis]|uniref:hypothetical protein n=1 Tax=Nocardia takedensis TaxID=259390 RepID=UPI00030519EE|nr:hypothetical protein [Nocardia takedensis]
MSLRAIGLLHLGFADEILSSQTTIEALAERYEYTLVNILSIDYDTFVPTTLIVDTAAKARAAVIIAADLEHFGTAYKAVPRVCPVLLPTGLIPAHVA